MRGILKLTSVIFIIVFLIGCNVQYKIMTGDNNVEELEINDLSLDLTYNLEIKDFITDKIQTKISFIEGEKSEIIIKTDLNILNELTYNINENDITITGNKDYHYRPSVIEIIITNIEVNQLNLDGNFYLNDQGNKASEIFILNNKGILSGNLDLYKVSEIHINSEGVSNINLNNIDVSLIEMNIKGTSTFNLIGKANQFNLVALGTINVNSIELVSEEINLDIEGVVNANVNVNDTLVIKAEGVCTIKYIGDPEINQQINGVINIKKYND